MVSKSSTRLVYSFIQYSSLMLFLAYSVKAGKPDMIEASISVKNAEPKHEGFYKCNSRHNHTFYLHVNDDLYTTIKMSIMSTKLPKITSTTTTTGTTIASINTTTFITPTTTKYKDILFYKKNDDTFVTNNDTLLFKNTDNNHNNYNNNNNNTHSNVILQKTTKIDSEVLKPNYDVPKHKLKLYTIRSSLVLSCNVTAPNSEKLKLEWKYKDQNVTKVFQNRPYQIINAERRFILDRPEESDAGTYECHIPELRASAQFIVIAAPMAKLPKNTPVVEGEKLTITCVAIGTDPVFYWGVGNITYKESEDRVILSKDEHGHENAVLSYDIAVLEDRGNFTCFVKNNLTYNVDSIEPISTVTYVRVKGKLAALWPFIGIVAEVFVLCAIILIYEKRRNKQEPEESDTDSPEIKNEQHGKESEVRHRK